MMAGNQISPVAEDPHARVQQARLLLASSNAIALQDTGAPAAEIAASLTEAERAALPVAIRAVEHDLAQWDDVSDAEIESMVDALVAASTRMQPHLDTDKRDDWVSVLQADLRLEPFALAMEGIARAAKVCKFPSEFLPTVLEYVEPQKIKLREALGRYQAILGAAR